MNTKLTIRTFAVADGLFSWHRGMDRYAAEDGQTAEFARAQ